MKERQNKTPSGLRVGITALAFGIMTTLYGEYIVSREVPSYVVGLCTIVVVASLGYTIKSIIEYIDSKFNKSVTNKKQK